MDSDLSSAKALCEAMGGTYDEEAVRLIVAMERLLARLRVEQFDHFRGILHAIENQVEDRGAGDPGVVRILGDALFALAALHHLKPPSVKRLTHLLGQLHSLVVDRAASLQR